MACAATTAGKRGKNTISRQPSATSSPEATINRRFARAPSTTSPAGTWHTAAAMEDAAMATPIAPASQCSVPFRNTDR